MIIAHISDIHIRNLKFHSDYKKVFQNFYRELEERRVDLVVNTGDTAHTKTNISPEFVDMASTLFTETSKRAPMLNVLGNHDLNLMNEDRQDAITPIVEALNRNDIILLKKSGKFDWGGINFWNFGISDVENWPRPPYDQDSINIGLFHGSIRNCVTDSLFRMTHVEYDQDIFEGLDFVMMGDIHKRQWFNNGRVWYAGSMIQQNFGEDPEKGFLLWDIKSRDEWSVEFVELKGSRRFYTIRLNEDLRVPDMNIEPDSRIRISPPKSLTLVEQKAIEKIVKKKFNPHDVITLGAQNVSQMFSEHASQKIENLRDAGVQENLLRSYLAGRKISPDVMAKVLDLNHKYHLMAEQKDETARGVNWRVLKLGWNNLFNYGEGNVLDFSQIKGLSGIFAPNAAGKSSMIDAVTIGMFDANTKEVSKNVHLINDNKDKAVIILELLANNERYAIQREIERIKVGKRKGEEKEWGKTTLDFVRYDKDGGVENLVAELRPDTEKRIRRRFGNFDDFMLTSLFAQWDPMDLIMCKETDRKRILFRFLDLDIFEEKSKLAKEDYKEWSARLDELEDGNYEEAMKNLEETINEKRAEIETNEAAISKQRASRDEIQAEIEHLLEEKSAVPQLEWKLSTEQGHLKWAESEIERLGREIEKIKKQNAALTSEIEEHEVFSSDDGCEKLDVCRKNVGELEASVSLLEKQLREHELHVENRERQLTILGKVPCGDNFPTCQFLVDAFEAKKSIGDHKREVGEIEAELGQARQQLDEWRVKLLHSEARHEHRQKVAELRRKIESNKLLSDKHMAQINAETSIRWQAKDRISAIEKAAADILKNEQLDTQIANARLNLREIERVMKMTQDGLSKQHEELGSSQGVLERVRAALATLKEVRDTCEAFELFNQAMGKDGIALQVLTQKLPVINEEINKILGSAAEFGVYIEYSQEDQSIRLYIQYGQYKSRLLELGSGAEKFLASVAIRSALLSISNLPRPNMFIIDEGFGKLDPQNIEAIQRMFDYLKSVFDHVIVISHTDVMKDMVDNIIDITADDEGYAHVEIGG